MFTCSASPAGSWPSLLRALGNTPPLIKLMSVEIAIFNHFDVLGTKEMLFPPSGGLDSIKAAPSVKNNTLLGGCFFSPSPLKELLLQRGACKRRAVLQTAWHLLCSFCSAKCLHLKISSISCCLERVFLCWYLTAHPSTVQWQWQYWVCPCCYTGVPSHSSLLGLGSSVDTKLHSSSFCPCDSAFLLHYWQVSQSAWEIWQKPSGSAGCWAHQTFLWPRRQIPLLSGRLAVERLICQTSSQLILQRVYPSPNKGWMILTHPSNANPFNYFPPRRFPNSICWNGPDSKSPRQLFLFKIWTPFSQ